MKHKSNSFQTSQSIAYIYNTPYHFYPYLETRFCFLHTVDKEAFE